MDQELVQGPGSYDASPTVIRLAGSIILSFIIFHLIWSQGEPLSHDLCLFLLASIISLSIFIIKNFMKKRNDTNPQRSNTPSNNNQNDRQTKSIYSLFNGIFTSEDKLKERRTTFRQKKSTKYEKADLIMHDLLAMWVTTYTVISFGSARILGSTLNATERLMRKIRTKYKSPRKQTDQSANLKKGTDLTVYHKDNRVDDDDISMSSRSNGTETPHNKSNIGNLERFFCWSKKPFRRVSKVLFSNRIQGRRSITAPQGLFNNY